MKRITNAALAAVMALGAATAAVSAAAAAKADFTGVWKLDVSKSEGLPPMIKGQTMSVKQTGDRVEIETTITSDEGEQIVKDAYTLDGKEVDHVQKAMGMEGKGKRTSKWSADGNGIEVSENAHFETAMGAADVKATRKWTLSADGKTLTIVMDIEGPMGPQTIKRVFVKQ